MTASVRMGLVVLVCGVLGGCSSGGTTHDDCVSHYDPVAGAPTWGALKEAMLDNRDWGRVASVRTQARGEDVGAGSEPGVNVVRVVDLLDRSGRRLIQVDVWRAHDGAWRAGAWAQCID